MLILVVLMAMAETISVLSIMPFLSVLGRPAIIQESPALLTLYHRFEMADARQFIFLLGIASVVLVVASSLFKTITLHVLNRFVHMERHSIATRLLSRYLQQPYEFFLVNNPSILAKNVLSEVDQLLFELIQPLSQLLAQCAVLFAMTALILCYDAVTAVYIMSTLALLYGSIYILVRKRLAHIGAERQKADGERYQACNEALGGIKDVKVTHAANAYLDHFERASHLFSRHFATNETLAQSPLYLVEATGYTGLIVIALVLLLKTNDIAHVLPALGLYGFAAYRMLPSAQIMYRGLSKVRFASSILDSITRDLALPEDLPPTAGAVMSLRREIRLQGIRYAYPSAPDKWIFDGFDLVIPANGSVGIVGKSGAGKSTLMDILLGLLHPQEGAMSVDGVTITANNAADWQRTIGYVPQHIYLSDSSVAENIAFGIPYEAIDTVAVERAARAAQIHDFVVGELPQGYGTRVGDRGVRLSGGQRQRVGIARALYHDPAVMLMDEATSALDEQTEDALNEAIRQLSGSKTIIVIAHKKSSLRYCQQVITVGNETGATRATALGALNSSQPTSKMGMPEAKKTP